jgi:hypothetical protein
MSPITPHIEITAHTDGVHIRLKTAEIVVPASMAATIADKLRDTAEAWCALGLPAQPLPTVTPKGDVIK